MAAILTLKALTGTRLWFWNIISEALLDIYCIFSLIFPASSEGWTFKEIDQCQRVMPNTEIMIRLPELFLE
jgi:hypothetical protein